MHLENESGYVKIIARVNEQSAKLCRNGEHYEEKE